MKIYGIEQFLGLYFLAEGPDFFIRISEHCNIGEYGHHENGNGAQQAAA
jgi:hypothetical protein